jgi:hypothetical protein
MLQISTGKFFKHESYETLRRAIYYTNYHIFRDDRIETQVGSLQQVFGIHGLGALTCEIIERIQKMPGGPYSGELIATGGDTLINDFAAIVSFALNITCTPDLELARRLVANERPSLGADLVPQKYVPRMFDRAVNWQPGDADHLQHFVTDLMALERKSYEGAMRAIRRYVIGAHRISDDVNLAYALFVMSMESLAQTFDGFEPAWADYEQGKRRRIDDALEEAPETTVNKVRAAVLANEHVAIAQRFRELALAHVGPSFFREEAEKAVGAVSRPDLVIALRQAYSIRSTYVHHLKDIPRLLVGIDGFHETMAVDGQPTLTFAGLARVARHVINTFVARAPKTETEDFDWRKDLPGMLTMQAAPQYWLGNPQGFDVTNAQRYLVAFIGQVVGRLFEPSATVTDIRPVLEKVEALVPGLAKPAQRLPMLALYFIFNFLAPENSRSPGYAKLVETYKGDFEAPSIMSLAGHLVTGQNPDWPLSVMEELHARYFRERHHANTLQLGRMLEAAFTLRVAEQSRSAGNWAGAQKLIAFAVETWPTHVGLRNFEMSLQVDDPVAIDWHAILLPAGTASSLIRGVTPEAKAVEQTRGVTNRDQRQCSVCDEVKPIEQFRDVKLSRGYGRKCQDCKNDGRKKPRK